MLKGKGRHPAGGGGGGSVAFDAVSSASVVSSGGFMLSWTHTPVGTPTAVAVTMMNYDGGALVNSVTYGGVAMTLAVTQAVGVNAVKIFGLPNPTAGAQTVEITFNAVGAYCQAGAITVTGSDTATCFHASPTGATGSDAAPTVTTATATGELAVDVVGSTTSRTNTVTTQTLTWGPITVAGNIASSSRKAASGTTTTMAYTQSAADSWGIAAAAFKL